jgi:hypothetical protein
MFDTVNHILKKNSYYIYNVILFYLLLLNLKYFINFYLIHNIIQTILDRFVLITKINTINRINFLIL